MGLRQTLYTLACPRCGQDDSLVIQMWRWCHVTNTALNGDDGETIIEEAETNDGPYNIADHAQACCWSCNWHGAVTACEAAGRQLTRG